MITLTEKKQTVTGGQTTLHTTSTIFQVKSDNNNNTKYPEIGDILDEDEETDFWEFKISNKRASPTNFQILLKNLLMLNYLIFHLKEILLGYYWVLLEITF